MHINYFLSILLLFSQDYTHYIIKIVLIYRTALLNFKRITEIAFANYSTYTLGAANPREL